MFDPCNCCCMRWKLRRSPPHTAQSKGFKLYKGPYKRTQQVPTTTPNIVMVPCKRTQQVTTLLGPTLLGVVGQQCCVRLHGPKSLTGQFKLYATSANKCQQVPTLLWFHANGRNKSQHCWAQQRWVLLANMMLGLFVWALMYQRNFAWSYMPTCTSNLF